MRNLSAADYFEQLDQWAQEGNCPALIFDDNGHWAVSFDGIQTCQQGEAPESIQTTFFIEADDWRENIFDAIDAAIEKIAKEEL